MCYTARSKATSQQGHAETFRGQVLKVKKGQKEQNFKAPYNSITYIKKI